MKAAPVATARYRSARATAAAAEPRCGPRTRAIAPSTPPAPAIASESEARFRSTAPRGVGGSRPPMNGSAMKPAHAPTRKIRAARPRWRIVAEAYSTIAGSGSETPPGAGDPPGVNGLQGQKQAGLGREINDLRLTLSPRRRPAAPLKNRTTETDQTRWSRPIPLRPCPCNPVDRDAREAHSSARRRQSSNSGARNRESEGRSIAPGSPAFLHSHASIRHARSHSSTHPLYDSFPSPKFPETSSSPLNPPPSTIRPWTSPPTRTCAV
jgi:hypothetical protein